MCEIHFCTSSGQAVCVSFVSVVHREITKARIQRRHLRFLIRLHIRLKLNHGGALGASAPPLFVPGEKVPFCGNESALFSWNRSAVLAKLKCPFWSVPPHFQGASAASDYTC